MTQEDRDLLMKDLCGRLPYEPKARKDGMETNINLTTLDSFYYGDEIILPYLRPMSSMTEKEYETFPIPYSFDSFSTWNNTILSEVIEGTQILIGIDEITEIIDWLNAHYFDYRGLIEKGVALEAPEGMYKN